MRTKHPTRTVRRKGAALVEYVVLMGLLAVVVIFTIVQLGAGIRTVFDDSSTTVASEIETATGIPIGGDPTDPGTPPGGGGGDPLVPNTPGGAPPVGLVVALDFTTSFRVGGDLSPYCVTLASDPTGNDVWCRDGDLETRPSNLEWRVNGTNSGDVFNPDPAAVGAPIWHGQLCLYNTDAGAFVPSLHYVYDGDPDGDPGTADAAMVPGLAGYDGTWLMCQGQNQPSAGLIMDNGVAAWDYNENPSPAMWYPAPVGTRGTLPNEVPFTAPPTWSTDFGTLATECPYSLDMQRWLTYDMQRQTGVLVGDVPCQ
jgi:Flp pilus assembly pilin Flp